MLDPAGSKVLFLHLVQVPDGRVTEGDQRGSNWIMDSVMNTPQGFRTVKYTTNKMVGSGSFGVVFQAVCVESGQMVSGFSPNVL